MRYLEAPEHHLSHGLLIDSKVLNQRAFDNGVIAKSRTQDGRRFVELTPRVLAWLELHVGEETWTWMFTGTVGASVIQFAKRSDAMHFKLVWG